MRKREEEILHNYMEVLASNCKDIEPDIMTDSICKIYDSLNRPSNMIKFWLGCSVFADFIICVFILVVNFFRRKSR